MVFVRITCGGMYPGSYRYRLEQNAARQAADSARDKSARVQENVRNPRIPTDIRIPAQ
jgi:hypothetical protein